MYGVMILQRCSIQKTLQASDIDILAGALRKTSNSLRICYHGDSGESICIMSDRVAKMVESICRFA